MPHPDRHFITRVAWLRASVLGANDGIVSTAGLVVGVAAAGGAHTAIVVAGLAGLVAGAMSMAAGEYVSVSSQADSERADIARERDELTTDAAAELRELTVIYVSRGLEPVLARQVAEQLTAHDALGAHIRDELGIAGHHRARPLQAAFASAGAFAIGAALPLLAASFAPIALLPLVVTVTSLVVLVVLGSVAARTGGASPLTGALRVAFWGAIAMALTYGAGRLFGAVI